MGTHSTPEFGSGLSLIGDMDGDWYDDVVVGSNKADYLRGRAWYFPGSVSGIAITASVEMTGDLDEAEGFGTRPDAAGDLDGDGYDDLIVLGSGGVHVFYGGASEPDTTADLVLATTNLQDAAGAGDVDRDGYADVAVNDGSTVSL